MHHDVPVINTFISHSTCTQTEKQEFIRRNFRTGLTAHLLQTNSKHSCGKLHIIPNTNIEVLHTPIPSMFV